MKLNVFCTAVATVAAAFILGACEAESTGPGYAPTTPMLQDHSTQGAGAVSGTQDVGQEDISGLRSGTSGDLGNGMGGGIEPTPK